MPDFRAYVRENLPKLDVSGPAEAEVMAAASWLRSLLYGVAGHDPATLLASDVVLTVMAVFAAYIPARRASLVDPVVSLRQE